MSSTISNLVIGTVDVGTPAAPVITRVPSQSPVQALSKLLRAVLHWISTLERRRT